MNKKLIAALLLLMCLLLAACGGGEEAAPPAVPVEVAEQPLAAEAQQLVATAVKDKLASAEFAAWQDLYRSFADKEPASGAEVTAVAHYAIADFSGAPVDCYLVEVAADVAHWVNEEKQQGAVEEQFLLLVDALSGTVWDSISTDALGVQHDTATEQGRATYLLWMFDAELHHSFNGYYLNDSESRSAATAADLAAINAAVKAE